MEITQIKPLTVDVVILHPANNKPVGLTITVKAMEDDGVKQVQRRIADRRLKLGAKGQNFKAEDLEENAIVLIVAAAISWDWTEDADGEIGSFNGEQLDFNGVNVRKVLVVDWIRSQVEDVLGDTSRFFQS